MKVLLVGGGGREHALAWRIVKSTMVSRLFVTNSNPGFPVDAVLIEGDPVAAAVAQGIELVVVGPEGPLAAGLSDRLRAEGIDVFAPSQAAAQLETSKEFAKSFMDRHGIPTGHWSAHTSAESAHLAIDGPCVVKADGLAAGKGVVVAATAEEAHKAVDHIFGGAFGDAGERVIIEELLVGPELSVLAICDGERAVPLLPCRDHKRRFADDQGPNTGGMGAICPPADATEALLAEVHDRVLQPTVDGMASDGIPFKGVLYAGIMVTSDGPKVLEFNVRFGDPECQPLMVMLDEDIVPVMLDAARGSLPDRKLRWKNGSACCVVMVSGGYPGTIEKGKPITGVPAEGDAEVVFYAGAARKGELIVSNGGRVLGVTAVAENIDQAQKRAYEMVQTINFEGAAWRPDIGGQRRS